MPRLKLTPDQMLELLSLSDFVSQDASQSDVRQAYALAHATLAKLDARWENLDIIEDYLSQLEKSIEDALAAEDQLED